MKTLLLLIALASHPVTDTLSVTQGNIEFLYQMLIDEASERIAEEDFSEEGYEELLQEYLFLQENPVNINSEEVTRLEELGLLNAFQVESLRLYRRSFGDLLFVDELLMLDGFDKPTVTVIAPIIRFGKSETIQEREKITAGKLLTRGKHQLSFNYAQKFEAADDDYLGSPQKMQVKYNYHYGQQFRVGFVMEKDAGEPFLFHRLSDSLRSIVSGYRSPGFDFYGAHLYLSNIPLGGNGLKVKDLVLGDYQLSFGQGLTLWSGLSFGKVSEGSTVMRRAAGLRPKASASEGKFLRGAAATMRYRDFYATAFYSIRRIDATVTQTDTLEDIELVTALQETGYHRTLGELSKRHRLLQQVFGGHLCYASPQLEVGLTGTYVRLGAPLQLTPTKYNQFYFQGQQLTNLGMDFRWLVGNFAFFGELAHSGNGAFAGLVGMTVKPKGYLNFSLMYRNYDKRYQNLFNGAFGEGGRRQGEEGLCLGIQCAPAPGWDLLAYCDFFRMTWLGSQVYNPSWGQEYSVKVSHQFSKDVLMQLRIKSKTKMKNSNDDHVFSYYPIFYTKRSVQFQLSYVLFDDLFLSSKLSYNHYLDEDGVDSKGYLLCQDFAYKPERHPFSLTLRYALFSTDDYNSRISMYENDVLGAFSIPSLSGTGQRIYLLGKIKLFGSLSLYSRIGLTLLEGETKTDFKAEVIWKK